MNYNFKNKMILTSTFILDLFKRDDEENDSDD